MANQQEKNKTFTDYSTLIQFKTINDDADRLAELLFPNK